MEDYNYGFCPKHRFDKIRSIRKGFGYVNWNKEKSDWKRCLACSDLYCSVCDLQFTDTCSFCRLTHTHSKKRICFHCLRNVDEVIDEVRLTSNPKLLKHLPFDESIVPKIQQVLSEMNRYEKFDIDTESFLRYIVHPSMIRYLFHPSMIRYVVHSSMIRYVVHPSMDDILSTGRKIMIDIKRPIPEDIFPLLNISNTSIFFHSKDQLKFSVKFLWIVEYRFHLTKETAEIVAEISPLLFKFSQEYPQATGTVEMLINTEESTKQIKHVYITLMNVGGIHEYSPEYAKIGRAHV